MTARLLKALILSAALSASPLTAQSTAEDFRQLRSPREFELRQDRAYLLLRMDTDIHKFSAVLLRVPGAEESAAYEAAKHAAFLKAGAKAGPYETFAFDYRGRPNLFNLASWKPYAKEAKLAFVLAEVKPGDYVLYGQGMGDILHQCFCLGTVGFAAPAGEITDLGTILFAFAARPSDVPELRGEVDLGPSASMDYALFAAALLPQPVGGAVPTGLDSSRVRPARLRAIGAFLEPNANVVNRLAPVPGVLAYDNGRVIDVASSAEAVSN